MLKVIKRVKELLFSMINNGDENDYPGIMLIIIIVIIARYGFNVMGKLLVGNINLCGITEKQTIAK